MPDVSMILMSDLHLSHNVPAARAAEPNWYEAQLRALDEISDLQAKYRCPIILAGDVFDTWRSPPELINWAMKNIPPRTYVIAGQHDLPYHSWVDRHKSAYWSLVAAKAVTELPERARLAGWDVLAYWWGRCVVEHEPEEHSMALAVVHAYIGQAGSDYPGAPKESYVPGWRSRLRGYNAAVFGDNHKGFLTTSGSCRILNNGTIYRRKADEMNYRPGVGLLHDDGTIVRHHLDTSEDKWTDEAYRDHEIVAAEMAGMQEFVKELGELAAGSLDYRVAVQRYIAEQQPGDRVAKLLLQSIGQ